MSDAYAGFSDAYFIFYFRDTGEIVPMANFSGSGVMMGRYIKYECKSFHGAICCLQYIGVAQASPLGRKKRETWLPGMVNVLKNHEQTFQYVHSLCQDHVTW